VKSEECGRAPGRREGAWPRRIAALGALGGLVAAAAVGLAACGGSPSSPGSSSGQGSASGGSPQLAKALKFSQCMRTHGITGYPDPTAHGRQISISIHLTRGSDLNPHSPRFQAAQNACKSFMPSGNLTAAQKAAANAKALRYSACMRSHGISSYPDPNGQGTIVVAAGGGIDPTSPQFQNAQKACQRLDNGFNMDTSNFPS
jgi:hypothetical protein